ncbi:hypothetical protein EI94DRAFT_1706051 [Lactarius quietus]|nr:hypothetical protein EI94DRAFT_1706051 [Lactarius quietus]
MFNSPHRRRRQLSNRNTHVVFELPDGGAVLSPITSLIFARASECADCAPFDKKGNPAVRPYTPTPRSEHEGEPVHPSMTEFEDAIDCPFPGTRTKTATTAGPSALDPLFILSILYSDTSRVQRSLVKPFYQNDPGLTVIETILDPSSIPVSAETKAKNTSFIFLKGTPRRPAHSRRTNRSHIGARHFWCQRTQAKTCQQGKAGFHSRQLQLIGLAGSETIRVTTIETLRKYGVRGCGLPGFYSTIDVHMDLERNIADFLGTDASILYSQGFSTIPCVIFAFAKRWNILFFNRGINCAIQRATNFHQSADAITVTSKAVCLGVEKERRKRRGPLTRRFIVTKGILEKDGAMVDLPKFVKFYSIRDSTVAFCPQYCHDRPVTVCI